mmetsp:Transcript_22657/g.44453  ORF Transcript_22657/g.44453 Transcript_22657/m.44453 type:complete len:306 (-) Transcript_22657:280-1197(-)
MLMLGNGSLVNHSLTVVLFGGFKLVRRQLRETIGDTVKPDVANLFLNAAVLDGNDGVLNNQGLAEATLDCDTLEVGPVESATEAFSPENRILAESFRNTTFGVDVGELHHTTLLQQGKCLLEHGALIGAEINDAVGGDDIKRRRLKVKLVKLLKVTLEEAHIGFVEAKLLTVELLVLSCNFQLLVGHIHAHHKSVSTYPLSKHIDITTTARSKIQDAPAINNVKFHATTAIVFGEDLVMHIFEGALQTRIHCSACATRVCFEVIAVAENLTVVLFDGIFDFFVLFLLGLAAARLRGRLSLRHRRA